MLNSILQTANVKTNLAVINVSFDGAPPSEFNAQLKIGELRSKKDEIYAIAKRHFAVSETYKGWKADIAEREYQRRIDLYNDGQKYTPFTIPRGKWLRVNGKGQPVAHNENAITALKYHFEDEDATVLYDHWKNSISVTNLKSKFPRESKDFVVKNYINRLVGKFNILFTMDEIKFGLGQLAANNSRHSMLDYFDGLKWDKTPRLRKLLTDIMKASVDEDGFQLSVVTKQLVASVRRVRFPGAKYDMCPLLISTEGFNKSSFLMILYGRRNVLAEDILDLTSKEQSEKLRNGIMCVEFADTLGDEKKFDARKIKAFITRQDDVGRDAYGRVEDVEHIGRTNVYWHTGNNPHLLTSEEGNRRFIPFYLTEAIDLNLLRQEKDQIWAEVVELERTGRAAYEAEMRSKNIPVSLDDKVYPDIMLEKEYWPKARLLQDQAKKKTGYEELLSHVLFWPNVGWEPPKDGHCAISILSDNIKSQLAIPDYKWNREAQKISRVMKTKVELRQEEGDGLSGDVCWSKVENLKRGNSKIPLNGYIIELWGESGAKAYAKLKENKDRWDKKMGIF
jgi:Virulence-associated protein E